MAYRGFKAAILPIAYPGNAKLMPILIGIDMRYVKATPRTPAMNPIAKDSILNNLPTSFFLAPTDLNIPISLVLSRTDT